MNQCWWLPVTFQYVYLYMTSKRNVLSVAGDEGISTNRVRARHQTTVNNVLARTDRTQGRLLGGLSPGVINL